MSDRCEHGQSWAHCDEPHPRSDAQVEEDLLNKIYDGLAKSGLAVADYMAIIQLIEKIANA